MIMSADPLVGHINLAKGFRGGERQTQLLITELAKLGWKQRLIVRKGSALPARVIDVDQLQVVEVASNAVAAGIAIRGCQLTHAHEARAIYAGLVGHWLFRIPYLATRRVPNAFSVSPLRNIAYGKAACIAVLSRAIASQVSQSYPDTRYEIIPSAHADLASKHNRDAEFVDKYRGKTIVGHIGALERGHKAQHNLIEVARHWQDELPNVLFLLVGSGRDEAEFKQLAAGLDNIEFAGQVNNVDDYLDLFDIFAFPSVTEGLGSILLDAMCFGLPIVASRVDGIPDIIEDGVNGLLVEPENPVALGEALEQLLGNEDLQQNMRTANLVKANDYSAAAMANSYDSLYRDLLGP